MEHVPVMVDTPENLNSPCSSDTSVVARLPQLNVSVTPGITVEEPSGAAIETEPAIDASPCARATCGADTNTSTSNANGASAPRIRNVDDAAFRPRRRTRSARPTALQTSSRSFRTSATARPTTGSRCRRPAANDELASSTPMRIGTILNATVTARLTVSSTMADAIDVRAGLTSHSV